MAASLHGSARTTPRIRAELQASQETTRVLAARYGLNPKTIAKWRRRTFTADARMGPSRPRSSVLTEAEEAVVVEFRRRTLLPLDHVLGCLREMIPTCRDRKVQRSVDHALYRQRNLIERFFNKLKHFRRIATRYEKTARNFLAAVMLAASRLWMRFESTT